jgi:hypothetical protein
MYLLSTFFMEILDFLNKRHFFRKAHRNAMLMAICRKLELENLVVYTSDGKPVGAPNPDDKKPPSTNPKDTDPPKLLVITRAAGIIAGILILSFYLWDAVGSYASSVATSP